MPLYEYQCDACGHRFEVIQKFSDPLVDDVPEVRRPRAQADVLAGVPVQGHAAGTSPTTPRRTGGARDTTERDERDDGYEGSSERRGSEGDARRRPRARRTPTARRARRRPATHRHDKSDVARLPLAAPARRRPSVREVLRELSGEVRPPQREIHHRLQEPQLVARVVADAFHFAGVDRPRLQQLAQAVGELDLAGAIALGLRERREDVGRQDVAADDRQVRRRFVRAAASRPDRAPGTRRRRDSRSARSR